MEDAEIIRLSGFIADIRYAKPGNDFGVSRLRVLKNGRQHHEVTIAGVGVGVFQKNDAVEVRGKWEDTKFGRQITVLNIFRTKPQSAAEWSTYLLTSIDGVGPSRAEAIVKHFGADIEKILDQMPERIFEVSGLARKTGERFIASWIKDQPNRSLNLVMAELGLSGAIGKRVIERFGARTEEVLRTNPYLLVQIPGIGFKRADAIAKQQGVAEDAPDRAQQAMLYVMHQQAEKSGHVWVEVGKLLNKCEEEGVDRAFAIRELKMMLDPKAQPRELIAQSINQKNGLPPVPVVYLRRYYNAELNLASNLARIFCAPRLRRTESDVLTNAIQVAESNLRVELNAKQRQAVRNAFETNVSILTGKAGTGKTTATCVVVEVANMLNIRFQLAAPTGRAAKRMNEVTNEPARTIHRLLEFNPELQKFNRTRNNPLDTELVIIDEFSMVDLELADDLIQAIRSGASLMMIGDPNQLLSVGAGRVLADFIDSKLIPEVSLTEIFRQAAESMIVLNAHKILNGTQPQFPSESARDGSLAYDCYFSEVPKKPEKGVKGVDPKALREYLTHYASERIPKRLGIDPVRELQVLVPQKKGECGMHELNRHLQTILNPRKEWETVQAGGTEWRIGDRVMQTKNNHELEIYNGDIGFVREFNREDKTLTVDFQNRTLQYDFSSLDQLQLAYAMTVHKMQGSEFKAVIFVLLKEHIMMLQRNLLYTGWTRAKKLLLVLGQKDAVRRAVDNKTAQARNSLLIARLRSAIAAEQQAGAKSGEGTGEAA